jgi:flagellar biosynthesis protein FlhF
MTDPIRIKTFRAQSLQDAYQQIRDEFGAAATILETKSKRARLFGRTQIEVTASSTSRLINTPSPSTTDKTAPESTNSSSDESAPKSSDPSHSGFALERAKQPNDSSADREPPPTNVENALEAEQGAGRPSSPFVDFRDSRLQRICTQVYREFCEAGVDAGIVEQWLRAARSSGNTSIFQNAWTLSAEIQSWVQGFVYVASPLDLRLSAPQWHILVGPSGVGKSTTIAKLAAHASMHCNRRVGVIQSDPRNVERERFLQHYAELLDWEFAVAGDSSLDHNAFQECQAMFVDTQGFSPDDEPSIERLREWVEDLRSSHDVHVHLVLASHYHERTFLRCERAFSKLNPETLILTKLDESGGLGPLFPSLQSCGVPVSYMTDGQHVPSNLISATPSRLARFILGTSDPC